MDTKKLKLPYGIPDYNLKEIEREIPTDEPEAWPVNDKLKHVGKRVKRYDAEAKVTGTALYTSDMNLAGMLYGKMLRSPYPHAKIQSIDVSAAESYPGVYAVHVFQHAIGMAEPQSNTDSSAYPDVKYAGQPILGVAASSMNIADEALKKVKIEYSVLPFVVDVEQAMEPDSPLVYTTDVEQEDSGGGGGGQAGLKTQGNMRGPSTGSFYGGPRGDLEKGFQEADVVLENTYRTQVHTHCSLESHGVVVDWQPHLVTVYSSTQNTTNVRDEFSEYFNLPRSKVRVIYGWRIRCETCPWKFWCDGWLSVEKIRSACQAHAG